MFLRFTQLKRLPVASSASRNTTLFVNSFCLQKPLKNLSIRKKWAAGRVNGTIIFKTRTSLKNRFKIPKINYKIQLKQLNFIASFQFLSFTNKLVSLIYFASGSVTYHITTELHVLFEYCYLNIKKTLRGLIVASSWSPIYLLPKLVFISFIELSPLKRAQYCLSAGTQSRLLTVDKLSSSGLIQLPSKVKKIISIYSSVLIGRIALSQKKKYKNTKSGYWRNFGNKPIVRGVAMNAVDHPHGGRTKSVRYPRTPWGKTTKYK